MATRASAAMVESRSGGAACAMRVGQHAREASQHVVAESSELVAADLGLRPGPDDRSVALVEIDEPGDPRAQRCFAGPTGLERAERLGQRLHLVGDLRGQCAEKLLFVGEVQVEGSVRGLRELHDVVDARREVSLRREHLRAGVEELAHRALSAGSQLPRRRRRGADAGACRRYGLTPGARASGGSLRAGHGVRVRGPDARVTFRAARPDRVWPAPLRSDADVR